jgi:methylated-DNA-[protein]-cysteine S-methyltransferase
MKRNPVPILVPCHRVVSKSGPGGFSAGDGLDTKIQIIKIEQAGQGSPVERWL